MLRLALIVLLIPTAARADKTYDSAGGDVTHDCDKDGNPVFNASGSKITITGKCKEIVFNGSSLTATIVSGEKISVNGSGNEVSIEAVGKLTVTGTSNKVTYQKGISGKPKVSTTGLGNKVSQKK